MSFVGGPPPKLPLGQTISLAYSSYFRDFIYLLHAAWLWMLVCAAVMAVASWQQWSWAATAFAGVKAGTSAGSSLPQPPIGVRLLGNIAYLVFMLTCAAVAVAWHRRILLGERVSFSGDNVATAPLWRYVGIAIALGIISMLPMVAVFPLLYLSPMPTAPTPVASLPHPALAMVTVLAMFVLMMVGVAIVLRLSVLLPARAVGDRSLTFTQAWQRTRGNTWRLFWGGVACIVPPYIFILIAFTVLGGFPNPRGFATDDFAASMTAFSTTTAVLYLLLLPISIGFLSHAYRYFFPTSAP